MCLFKVITSHPNCRCIIPPRPGVVCNSTASFVLSSFFVLFCCCELPGSENNPARHSLALGLCLPSHTNLLTKQGWAHAPNSTWDAVWGLPKLPFTLPECLFPQQGKALGCF